MTERPSELARDDALYEDLSRVNNELTNLHRALAQQNAELAQANEQKNRFVGMVSHDLRNPLAVILNYAEFLETETPLNAEQRELIKVIKRNSDFIVRMLNDLLDVTAIESGQLRLHRELVDLVAQVSENVKLNRALAAAKNIDIQLAPPPSVPTLEIDRRKIDQVLNNLIGNAVKFSHRDTRVTVRLSVNSEGVTVSVEDQGQGIPASEISKLFTPFGTTSVTATAGERSVGLGLAIVRRIVEGHSGCISVESEIGCGSIFRFTLPFSPAQ